MQIAWIPAGTSLTIADAQTALDQTVTLETLANGNYQIMPNGIRIFRPVMGTRSQMTLNDVIYERDSFSQQFDILDDFIYNNNLQNDNKLFVIQARKQRSTFKNFSLTGYNEKPVIDVVYPYRDLLVHNREDENGLVLRMKVNSAIGLKEDTIKIFVKNNGPENGLGSLILSGNEYRRTLSSQNLLENFPEGTRETYVFEATDILNNSQTVERTIIMSSRPTLQYITSSNAPGTYGIGKELRFEAVFSLPVEVIRSQNGPRLKLYFNDPGSSEPPITGNTVGAYANYVSSAGNTIIFSYTVKEGDKAPQLYSSLESVDLNGSIIRNPTLVNGEFIDAIITLIPDSKGGIQDRVALALDGIKPKIKYAGFTKPVTGEPYYNNGKTVTMELYTDKPVRVSGTPTAGIRYQAGNSGLVNATFSKVNSAPDGNSILFFTYTVNVGNDINESSLYWDSPWVVYDSESSITDMTGNELDISAATTNQLVTNDKNGINLGNQLGEEKRAWILTNPPVAPTFTLSKTNPANGNFIDGDPALSNGMIYININSEGASNTTLWYSLEAGNNPKELTSGSVTSEIKESDDPNKTPANSNKDNNSYIPSEFKLTAWQVDRAGNRSANAAVRDAIINARAPEIVDITCTEPNGSYSTGKTLNFKVVFSRNVKAETTGASLTLTGTYAGSYNGTVTIPLVQSANSAFSSSLIFTLASIPSNLQLKNIKATNIVLTGIVDEYGNLMKNYTGSTVEDASRRPIANNSTFNLNRNSASDGTGGLVIDSIGPQIIIYNPAAPENNTTTKTINSVNYAAGELLNGGIMAKLPETSGTNIGKVVDGEIVLTYDKNVSAQAGKNITIRPWNNWLIPPILTVDEMDALYNSPQVNTPSSVTGNTAGAAGTATMRPSSSNSPNVSATEFQARLKYTDDNGLPVVEGTFTAGNIQAAYGRRTTHNSYIFTSHGLNVKHGETDDTANVRPDISPKWVLAFDRNLDNTSLREVFNAAQWKWQTIPVTSGSVEGNGTAVITIKLPQPLEKGRIWEVIIDEGAFKDAAGNESAAIAATNTTGQGYRFWTNGTADPVIRVDRHSHGDNFHGHAASFRGDFGVIPKTDTKVRIDSETPGASIRFNTVKTSYALRPTGSAANQSNVFTADSGANTSTTAATDFFNHSNVPNNNANDTGATTNSRPTEAGYNLHNRGHQNNWIGNGGSHQGGTQVPIKDIVDNEGYFTSLLVPNTNETTTSDSTNMVGRNGVIPKSQIRNLGNNLVSAFSGGNLYRNYTTGGAPDYSGAAGFDLGIAEAGEAATGRFFYAGDGSASNSREATLITSNYGLIDQKLATGRRDYITSAAKKGSITSGELAGPPLNVSIATYEGVFKTIILLREPASTRLFAVQGYDPTPITPSTPGFPLREGVTGPSQTLVEQLYHSKQLWRVGSGNTTATGVWPTANPANSVNNHIWVSWDIVTDYYFKGRNTNSTASPFSYARLQRNGKNYGAVLATYGSVSYRFSQSTSGGAGATNNTTKQ